MSSYFIDHKSNENSGREIRKAARILTGNGQYIGYVGTYQFENMHGIDFADRLVPFYLCKSLCSFPFLPTLHTRLHFNLGSRQFNAFQKLRYCFGIGSTFSEGHDPSLFKDHGACSICRRNIIIAKARKESKRARKLLANPNFRKYANDHRRVV